MFKWPIGYVYIIKANGLYKIGSAKKLRRRLAQLRTASPYLEEVHAIPCFAFREVEKYLHQLFHRKREAGEWFSLSESDLDFIGGKDWTAFPPENHERQRIARVYEEARALAKARPDVVRVLRTPAGLQALENLDPQTILSGSVKNL